MNRCLAISVSVFFVFSASSFATTLLEQSMNYAREAQMQSSLAHEFNLSKKAEAQRKSYTQRVNSKIAKVLRTNQPRATIAALKKHRVFKLKVSIRSDGELVGIDTIESSGSEKIDQALLQSIEIAAPFSRFPVPLANELGEIDVIVGAIYTD